MKISEILKRLPGNEFIIDDYSYTVGHYFLKDEDEVELQEVVKYIEGAMQIEMGYYTSAGDEFEKAGALTTIESYIKALRSIKNL